MKGDRKCDAGDMADAVRFVEGVLVVLTLAAGAVVVAVCV